MKGHVLRSAPGRLGRLILRRLFDKAHTGRRPHLALRGKPQAPEANSGRL
jgi:hypothetical protein